MDRNIIKGRNINDLPWIEKYRPSDINDIVSHDNIIKSLKQFIETKSMPHMLFFGPSGTGKTSTIKCCINAIYGKYSDIMTIELNASNDRGIDTIRTIVKSFVTKNNSIFLPKEYHGLFKIVILDEMDSMTYEAQGMLRQIIEKYSKGTRFCLICNDIDKVDIALQSRCIMYLFSPLKNNEMKLKLEKICENEKIEYEKNVLETIVKFSKGDMRNAINILQHIHIVTQSTIKLKYVYIISGRCTPDIIDDIFDNLINLMDTKQSLFECINKINKCITDNNITIPNLLWELKEKIMEYKLTEKQKIYLIIKLSENEIYDSVNINIKNIVAFLCSLFVVC
jgi:replication factor C subunit 3/5